MPQRAEVWVGSGAQARLLTSISWWGDLVVTHRWPLGSWEAKWRMPLAPWERYPQIREGVRVDVRIAGWPYWTGQLADVGWDSGEMVAIGACRQAEEAICFDAVGQTTTVPDVALDQAIARGAVTEWSRPASLSNAAFGDETESDKVNYLGALLDAWSTSVSKRWYVDPWRRVRAAADPTTPTSLIIPDSGVLGVADEAKAGTVFGRYLDAATGTYETARYPASGGGRPEVGINLIEKHGRISNATAVGICQGVWSQLQARPGWTNGLTVRTGELLSMGGNALPLRSRTAGHMTRLLGVRDERGLSMSTDVVIGESIWNVADDTLTLNPVGLAPRDLGSIIEAAGGTLL